MEEITATYTQPFQNYPDVVSTLQLCEMLGVSERTVYRLLVTNQIKHFKVGRAYRIPRQMCLPSWRVRAGVDKLAGIHCR